MAPLRVEASFPWEASGPKLIFETTDEKWERDFGEGFKRYQSKTLEELDAMLQKGEEAILRELVNYMAAHYSSCAKAFEATCGTPGRLASLNRNLKELQNDRNILEQIKKEPLAKQIEEIRCRLEEVERKIRMCRWLDESLLPKIREENIFPIISENEQQSVRIPFFGSTRDAFRRGEDAIVSFPGVHGYAWEKLTQVSSEAHSPIVTSCIFLPDENAPGYGQHDPKADGSCYCIDLYGQKEKWACVWFSKWREQTFRAHSKGCNLLVVTKQDGSLGRSQQGEVRWLDEEDLPYKKVSIKDFAEMILSLPTK